MVVENNVALQPYNTFGIVARAQRLVCVRSTDDVLALLADHDVRAESGTPPFVLVAAATW
jgi:UDP-N-acetylmuramate dehydrogenase